MSTDLKDQKSDLIQILKTQREAFIKHGPPSRSERIDDLRRLRAAIVSHRTEIEDSISRDFGNRAKQETALMEIAGLLEGIKYLERNLKKFMRPQRRKVAMSMGLGSAWVEFQPLGVIGVMSPWNYPFSLAMMPTATAIAAGNRVMVKPSEFTPLTNKVIAKILGKVFTQEKVAVVLGEAEVGAAFSSLPFDHLVFTGSTNVGRIVMKAASENLVPVTLELGGKSPTIISKGFNLERAAKSIAFGKLANAGQTCIAPDYVLVHESERDAFIQALHVQVSTFFPSGPGTNDYTSIISDRHFTRLQGLLSDAQKKGAKLVPVGKPATADDTRARKLTPTVVLNVTDQMQIAHEEIFGPLLPVLTYRTIEEAIAYVNARPRPLALYYFGKDCGEQRLVLSRTVSGNVTVNGTNLHFAQDDLPFGGVGPSGMGAYHGPEGFRTLSHAKGVFKQGFWNTVSFFLPPYGNLAKTMLNSMIK